MTHYVKNYAGITGGSLPTPNASGSYDRLVYGLAGMQKPEIF